MARTWRVLNSPMGALPERTGDPLGAEEIPSRIRSGRAVAGIGGTGDLSLQHASAWGSAYAACGLGMAPTFPRDRGEATLLPTRPCWRRSATWSSRSSPARDAQRQREDRGGPSPLSSSARATPGNSRMPCMRAHDGTPSSRGTATSTTRAPWRTSRRPPATRDAMKSSSPRGLA